MENQEEYTIVSQEPYHHWITILKADPEKAEILLGSVFSGLEDEGYIVKRSHGYQVTPKGEDYIDSYDADIENTKFAILKGLLIRN